MGRRKQLGAAGEALDRVRAACFSTLSTGTQAQAGSLGFRLMRDVLQANQQVLRDQYDAKLQDALQLQEEFLSRILPTLDLQSGEEEQTKRWLSDRESVFLHLRKQKFDKALATSHIQSNLFWRLKHIPTHLPESVGPLLHLLPNSHDTLGHPILVIRAAEFVEFASSIRDRLPVAIEHLRLHLRSCNNEISEDEMPTMQYLVLLDLKGASVQGFSIDSLTWCLRECIPNFPGMLAAVFVINYSWMHSSVWNIVKRILPESTLSKIFFPSQGELLGYLSPDILPEDYGGILPPLSELSRPPTPRNEGSLSPPVRIQHDDTNPQQRQLRPYGHTRTPSYTPPPYTHTDLIRTLTKLFWARHKQSVMTLLVFTVGAAALLLRRRLTWRALFSGSS